VLKHGLRLAVLPAVSVLSVQITRLFGGAVIVEYVFGLGGLGSYTADAVLKQDFPVIQGIVPLAVIIAVSMSLLADLAFLKLNPRLRAEGA
jgi:peptide/nickel transport system permease protein